MASSSLTTSTPLSSIPSVKKEDAMHQMKLGSLRVFKTSGDGMNLGSLRVSDTSGDGAMAKLVVDDVLAKPPRKNKHRRRRRLLPKPPSPEEEEEPKKEKKEEAGKNTSPCSIL